MAVQINVAANQAALTASIQAGVQAYNQKFAQNNPINLSVNQRAFSQPLGRMTGDVKDFEAALAASNARVIAFGASTAVLGGVIRSFKELANVTIDVEKNLADINRVFGLTTSQLQKFSTDLFSVGKQTASSFDDASKAALEFSRQGLKAEEVLIRTKDALTLARVAGISTANSVDALTSTVNGFAATGVTTSQILNKLVAVEQDFAVGAGDLAEALSRTGQAAQEAGVSLDQLNALVTAAQQSTARGGAVIGNALKTIFTRLQRTETLDQLEAFNIAVRDVQGNTLPAVTVLQNFAGAYKNLGDAQRAQLSEQVAGVYQVNILKAIVGDLNKSQGVYAGALQRGASATNEAEVATAKLNQTLDALLKQTATSTQQLANNIGKVTFEPLARYGTEQLKSLVESMNEILEGEGVGSTFANGLLKGIRNVIAGPGAIAAFFTLFKLIQNSFTYLAQALPQIAGITTETQNRKNIEQSILQIMQQQGPVSQALAGAMGNQAAQAQLLLQLARQQTAEYQIQSTLAKQLATQLAGQGVRVKGSGGLQVTRAGGYIPAATRMAEVVGAQAGGYAPGKVVKSPVGGVMNTAEDVKYVPGFAQPFINPPAGSKAGRAHRQNAISRTGVDPYMNSGFIPNFVKKASSQFAVGRAFEKNVGFDIDVPPSWNNPVDFNEVLKKPVDKNFNPKLYQSNTFADAHSGLGHTSAENISKVINHIGQNYYAYSPRQGSKTRRLKIDDKTSIISQPDLLGDLFIRPSYTEIIGEGSDVAKQTETSSVSSLNNTAKKTLLNGVSGLDSNRILKRKIKMQFAQDRVYGSGFIPNFAPPTSAIRVPWFKKFGNASFDAVQPTLGISKAGDLDTFRQINFRSNAKGADKVGDSNIFAPLYEDFVFKALQLISQSKIKDELIRGYALQPGTDQKQSAYDAFLGDVAFEKKGFPKGNLTGSISQNLNDKYERYAKANPAGAAKIKESIMVFNELGHENQLPSDFGKNFTQLAGTSYSQMVKNSPDLVKGLSAETNSLLNNYVKNPAFLAMNAAKGFLPNFADPKIKTNSGKDAVESFYRKGSEVDGKKLTGGVIAFPVPQTTDLYSVGSSRVSIPGSGFGIPLYDAVLAEVSKKGAWLTSDRKTVSAQARRIWDGYRKLRTGDVNNKELPIKNWFLDPAFNNGSDILPTTNPQDLLKNKSTWPSENDPVWSLQHAYQFKKSQLNDKMSSGFIPNFASMISSSIKGKGNISAIKTGKNDYEIEGVEVGKKFRGQGLGSQLYGNIAQKIGSGSTIKSVLLPQEQALADYASGKSIPAKAIFPQLSWAKMAKSSKLLINGKEIAMSDFESGIAGHKYNAAKLDMALIELVNSHASGFIPNFAYQQAVMSLEEGMSGEKAVFDTKPFPHIRNKSQPTFSSAIADHGGLSNALSDSMRGQKSAGLMNDGFIPNFANSRSAKRRIQRNQQSQQTNNTGGTASFNPQQIATQAEKLAQDALRKINNAYQYIAVFGADFADIIENASKSATAKLKTSSANIKTSVNDLSNNLKSSFANISGKGKSSNGSKPPVMTSGPDNGIFSKITGALSKAFANPILAMILPQITGAITSQFAYGNKKRYELTESERTKQSFANTGVTSISTGAFVGNMILPGWGAAIGAAVGGLIAFSEATKAAKLTIGEMKEKISETNAKQSSAISDYKSNIELLASAVETGDEVSKAKYAKDLVYSLSSISDQNLNKTVEGKSPKQLEFLISDMNKKAAMQTAVLSASEKLKTGGKEVSFFDRFKQQTSEAIFEFSDTIIDMFKFVGNSIVDGFKYVAESTSKIWTFIVDKIKDPFFNFIDGLKESFSNLSDFLGSSLNMVMLGFQQYANDIKSFFGFGNEDSQKNLDNKLLAANQDYEDVSKKLTESIKKGLSKGIDLGLKGLDIATYINQNYSAYGMLSQSRERKTQNYKMQDVVSEYVGAGGGAGTSSFFGKIFGTGDKKNELDKYLFDLIKTVGKSGMAKDREAALEELRGNLIDKGLAGDEIDVLLTSLRKFGETGNYKGQYILSNFEGFITQLTAVDVTMQKTADQIAKDFGDFLKLKQSIEKNVNEYINQSKLNEVDLAANVQRQKISIEEKGRMSEFLGKPFESAGYRAESSQLEIKSTFEQAQRDQINQSMTMIADISKKLNYTSLGSLKKLEESLISQNYTLDERLQKIKDFIQESQTGFKDPVDKQIFTDQVKSAQTAYDISKAKNKEDVKTANYVYSLEMKRLQEARNFRLQLKSGFSSLNDEGDLMVAKLGKDLPSMFADGMANGIKAAIKETDNLGDALLGVAASFLDSISTTLMQAGTRKLIGSFGFENLFTAQKGGVVRAQSGMYVSGTGSGDKYPAMLENGEYVLNRRAVMAMGGPAALDTLNFSAAPRFASGGAFNAELSDIKSMEDGMTTFGLENSSLYKELRDAEIQKAEQARQKKRARQAQTAQMVGSIVASIATIGIGAGISNKMGNIQAGKAQTLSAKLNATGGAGMTNSELGSLAKFQKSGLLGNNFEYKGPTNIQSGFNSFLSGPSFGPNRALVTKPMGRQTGGSIGSRLSDTIPGYMEGGLYNSPMVKQYGAGMQSGGTSAVANNSNTVNNSNASNSFNFNTSVNRDGAIQMGADSSTYKQQDIELSNNLNTKIYGAVLDVIREQQRFGGSLAGTRKG